MKKVFYFTMMVMAVFVMAACSSSPSTPGDALKKYSGYLQSGDYENFVEGLAFDDSQDAAKVKTKYTYGNGETEEGEQQMVKKDGKWLMSIGK